MRLFGFIILRQPIIASHDCEVQYRLRAGPQMCSNLLARISPETTVAATIPHNRVLNCHNTVVEYYNNSDQGGSQNQDPITILLLE